MFSSAAASLFTWVSPEVFWSICHQFYSMCYTYMCFKACMQWAILSSPFSKGVFFNALNYLGY